MNYLAHLALSGTNHEIIMGNYAGDFKKGRLSGQNYLNLPEDYLKGLHLHRVIDSFTDTHQVVREAREMLHRSIGRSAGVAIDIIFDHFLAIDFELYYHEKLSTFAQRMYRLIVENEKLIPVEMRPFSDALTRNQWLTEYALISGMERTFNSMAKRYSFLSTLDGATDALQQNYFFYHACFSQFYPEIQSETQKYLKEPWL